MERVRFVKPVYTGDTIGLEGEITSLEDKDATRTVVSIHQEVKNQRGETVAVMDKRVVAKKRSDDA